MTSKWYSDESIRILTLLWNETLPNLQSKMDSADILLAAVLLPFLGRLSSHIDGNLNIQVKSGGIVFFKDVISDFKQYLSILESEIFEEYAHPLPKNTIVFHNALEPYKIEEKFSYMVTSPPYPNMIDYYATFFSENIAIEEIFSISKFKTQNPRNNIIGTPKISTYKKENVIDLNNISSKIAQNFLEDLKQWQGPKRAMSDIQSYYFPYYYIYFLKLELAYKNIETLLTKNFDGAIVVVNNTTRKFVIPVAQFITENWQDKGCEVIVDKELSSEKPHVGSINPKAVGFKARHTEYVLNLTRGL